MAKVDGVGSNALDFFIACQLGRVSEKSPQIHCIVLSKDKGFDPLLKYLNKNGLKCKRINSLLELESRAATKTATEEDPNYKRVVELLARTEKKSRPRKLNTLSQHISYRRCSRKKLPKKILILLLTFFLRINEFRNQITLFPMIFKTVQRIHKQSPLAFAMCDGSALMLTSS